MEWIEEVEKRRYRFIIPQWGESDEHAMLCLEPHKPKNRWSVLWEGPNDYDAYALGYVKAEEMLLRETLSQWEDPSYYEWAEERMAASERLPKFLDRAEAHVSREEKIVALAAFMLVCDERLGKLGDTATREQIEADVDAIFTFYFVIPSTEELYDDDPFNYIPERGYVSIGS